MPNQCGSSWACFDMTKACSGKGVLILAVVVAIVGIPLLGAPVPSESCPAPHPLTIEGLKTEEGASRYCIAEIRHDALGRSLPLKQSPLCEPSEEVFERYLQQLTIARKVQYQHCVLNAPGPLAWLMRQPMLGRRLLNPQK